MIHKAFNKSEIARRYFELKGEKLSNSEAANRFRSVRNPDVNLIARIVAEVYAEQKDLLR